MRNIKFRGKSVMTGEWVYGSLITNGETAFIVETFGEEATFGAGINLHELVWHQVDSDTVGQLLGLWDENGQDVYEGDVIEGMTNRETPFKGSVHFCEQNNVFGWHIQDERGGMWGIETVCTRISLDHINGSVIGNTIDNTDNRRNTYDDITNVHRQ